MQLSKTPTRDELQAFMDLPLSKVEPALRAAGYWSDKLDPEMTEYTIEATGMVEVEAFGEATVYARTLEDAKKKADQLSVKDFEWDFDCLSISDIIDWDVKVTLPLVDKT